MSPFDTLLAAETGALTTRLRRMLGDTETAEDLCQETLARALRRAPRDAGPEVLRAWLHRTARHLAIDELRRRARRPQVTLDDATVPADDGIADQDAQAALAALSAHQRLVLLLRFQAGLSLREVGALLDVGEDAARKRVARAREAFAAALRDVRADDDRPTVVVLMGRERVEPYERWLRGAGARVHVLRPGRPLDLAGADALLLTGSERDIHPRLYGAPTDARTVEPDLAGDLRDACALRMALAADLPVLGVCRGAQLLNVLFGGDLYQHVDDHAGERAHGLRTASASSTRRVLGATPAIVSDHHQAVHRLGRGLHVTATAHDGLVEAVEVPGRRFAVGIQWHPERGDGDELAVALLDAARTA